MLVELGEMSKAEREEYTWFGLYLWETRKQKACGGFVQEFTAETERKV
jgi:hypothetical protein